MRQLERKEDKPPSLFGGLLRRLRELATRDQDNGGLRETLEDLLEDQSPEDSGDQFTEEERLLLMNALSFGELKVDDVMVPRADICAIEAGASLPELVQSFHGAGHSRLLVFRDKLDEVVGVVTLRDLLPFWGDGEEFQLANVMRPVLVVPSTMRVLDLLLEMRDTRNRLAAVVDEFGGVDGLVTIEDLIHEILGEIHDEPEEEPESECNLATDGVVEVDARIDLDDLEELLGEPLHDETEHQEVDTLGGLIFVLIERIPETGETIDHPWGWKLEILDADPRRIKRVRVSRASNLTEPQVSTG